VNKTSIATGSDQPDSAADWFALQRSGSITSAQQAAFKQWLAQADNAQAYARLQAVWSGLGALQATPVVADTLAQAAVDRRRARYNAPLRWAAAATVVMAVALGFAYTHLHTPSELYATAAGEQRDITLSDGSRVTLNTQTQIAVTYSRGERHLELLTGEAHFDVVHDSARPFVVAAGTTSVRVLGTAFDIYRSDAEVRVAVDRGRVAVARVDSADAVQLQPGEMAQVARTEKTIRKSTIDLARIDDWRQGLVRFDHQSLREALDEVNRYTRRRIVVADEAAGALPVNGIFRIDDLDHFAQTMARLLPVSIRLPATEHGDIVLSSR
jgi:transmembrane sensor